MLDQITEYINFIRNVCSFGADELILQTTETTLEMLQKIIVAQRGGEGDLAAEYVLHMTSESARALEDNHR